LGLRLLLQKLKKRLRLIEEGHGDDTVEVGAQDPTTEIEEEAQALLQK
jgi:hypothetical protein